MDLPGEAEDSQVSICDIPSLEPRSDGKYSRALCDIAAEEQSKKYKERNVPTNLELSNQIKELEVKLSKKLFPQ